MNVLVIREFDEFSRILIDSGLKVINCPVIATVPVFDDPKMEEAFSTKADLDGVFITSPKAAEIFRSTLLACGRTFNRTVHVFGKRSFDLLKHCVPDIYFDESAATAKEMAQNIEQLHIKNKRFLFVCGDKALSDLPEFLGQNSSVERAIVYRTVQRTVDPSLRRTIESTANRREIAFVCFFSPSGVENFLAQFGSKVLECMRIAVLGKTTSSYLESRGFAVDVISVLPTAKAFADSLTKLDELPALAKVH